MEPLSALSIATAVVQFLDFTSKLFAGTYKIYTAKSGLREHTLERMVDSLNDVTSELQKSLHGKPSGIAPKFDQEILLLGQECDELGTRLLTTIRRIQRSSEHSMFSKASGWLGSKGEVLFSSFRSALLTVWNQSEIDSLGRNLESYKSHIILLMVENLRQQGLLLAKAQIEGSRDTKDLCQQILRQLDTTGDWRQAMLRTTSSLKLVISSDRKSPEDSRTAIIRETDPHVHKTILRSLQYREIDYRYERIAFAYQETFQWIFLESPGSRWADYTAWLRDAESPLYWVTGKPGSGKSTLMKFLVDDERTRAALQESANVCGKPLLVASVYLWNSGVPMQMSYEGLVQSLMCQVLRQDPDITRAVFPHWFEAGLFVRDLIVKLEEVIWVWEELNTAFRLAIKAATSSYKVVFFIDGLDEFVGDPSEIIDLVSNFLEAGVKVCASSRPWVAFEDAYGQRPHLRLQDLTQSDIKHYVTARLQDKPGFKLMERVYPDECRDMIDSVCEKSSGVFLWIVLVTRSLLEGLTDGDGIVHLQERLDNLPEDLEELFEKILKNLNRRNFPRACRLLKIHRSSTVALTLLDMSFVDNDHDGPDFALDMPLVVWDLEKKNDRANLTDRQLMALCKGLLEANRSETTRPFTAQIGYLHRTVRDFLEQDHVWSQVESAAGADFNHNMALYDVHLMRIKILTYTGITLRELWGSISSSIFYATKAEDDGSERQIKMLNEIDRAVTRAFTTPLPNKLTFQQTSGFHEQMYWFTNREGSKHQCSFLELAVLLLLYGYVEATLSAMTENQVKQQVPNLVHTALKHIDLRHLGLTLLPPTFTRPSPDQKMLQLLFRYGTDSAWISLDGSTPWSQLMGEVHYPNKFKILQLFIDTGGDPIHELVEKSEFKSIMPDNVKALLKRRKWSRYLRTSGPSGQRGGNHK